MVGQEGWYCFDQYWGGMLLTIACQEHLADGLDCRVYMLCVWANNENVRSGLCIGVQNLTALIGHVTDVNNSCH